MDCNGDNEGNADCDEGGGQVTVTVTKRAMMTETKVAGNKEGNGDGDKSNADGKEGGGQAL